MGQLPHDRPFFTSYLGCMAPLARSRRGPSGGTSHLPEARGIRDKEVVLATDIATTANEGKCISANGIEIHYVEAGTGEPLLLIDNCMVSTNPLWAGIPAAYIGSIGEFAKHFRVIVPDTRGSGRTVHSGGPISHTLLADDVAALIEALGLDQPLIAGFSDGGEVATILGIRHPGSVRAIVNLAGYDQFNPDPNAPIYVTARQIFGGSPEATEADVDGAAQRVPQLGMLFQLMERDHDAAQGPGHWRMIVGQSFGRITQPHGYTVEDLRTIAPPTLILIGDRDPFCSVEEGAAAYRALPSGELAVLPNTEHGITPASVAVTIEFFQRHR
jgi:pimeloyl-ACP methyl ester carboxylesterase